MTTTFRSQRAHLQFIFEGGTGGHTAELIRAAARGGVDSVQIRAKSLGAQELLDRTLAAGAALKEASGHVLLLVNDRLDVALLAGANGVHLPETAFHPHSVADCRRLAALARAGSRGAPLVVGRSIHTPAAGSRPGTEDLDYVLFGHVFPSPSKPGTPPRGLGSLRQAVSQSRAPVLAVGGITAENARSAVQAGAAGVAVISAIRDAPDPYAATVALRRAIDL